MLIDISACVVISTDRVVVYGTVEGGNNTHVIGRYGLLFLIKLSLSLSLSLKISLSLSLSRRNGRDFDINTSVKVAACLWLTRHPARIRSRQR
jgi:hypothetical protein